VRELNEKGIQADCDPAVEPLVEQVAKEAQPGDVLLVMSNGAFGGFIEKTLAALKARG